MSQIYMERFYKKEAIIWMERSRAMPYFFIIKSGQLQQSLHVADSVERIFLNAGDTFGFIECLTGHSYLNRLVAVQDTVVIMVKKENVIPFLSQKKDIFFRIVADYSGRLRKINHKLFSLCSKSIYSEMPRYILEIAEYFKQKKMLSHYLFSLARFVENAEPGDEALVEKVRKIIDQLRSQQKISPIIPEIQGSRAVYNSGDIIFLEQEKGNQFYFIERGKVKISHIDKEKEFIIAILGEGEFFGEMSILNQHSRNATATAFQETRLLILDKDTFMNKLGVKILQNIFTSLARRMWYSYRRSINLSYRNPVTRLYDCLDFIMDSKEGKRKDRAYFFDISLKDLRVMTNTLDVDDSKIKIFLNDENINVHYDLLSISNLEKFEDTLKVYLNREKKM